MPTTKTAEKEMRVARRRETRNQSVNSKTKTHIDSAESAIASGDLDAAKAGVKKAVSKLDKEAKKGTVHPNNAARRKSRLIKKLNKAAASTKAEKSK